MAQWSAKAVCQLCLALTSLLTVASGCTGETSPVTIIEIEPLGYHEVEVGKAWTHNVKTNRDPTTLDWHLQRGPGGLGLLLDGGQARLVWTPTAFDLGANKPGEPRLAGVIHGVELEARASDGSTGHATGQVRAVPTALADGIDAPSHVLLNLDVRRAGRWLVRTDTTTLLGAPVQLVAKDAPGFELLTLAPGLHALRFRPTEEQIRSSPYHAVDLLSTADSGAPLQHRLTVELVGRRAAVPCQDNPPTVLAQLPTQVTIGAAERAPDSLDFSILVVDPETSASRCTVHTWPGTPGADTAAAATTMVHGQFGPTPVGIPMPAAGTLTAVAVLCSDLDDPLLGHCDSTGRWPARGLALLGSGAACIDDPSLQPAAKPLRAGDVDNIRHCPATIDNRPVIQLAGQALAILVDSPAGWPITTLRVRMGSELLCQRTGPHNRCWLAAPKQDRTVVVELEAQAASSSHLEVRAMQSDCLPVAGSDAHQPHMVTTTTPVSLCPGQRATIEWKPKGLGLYLLDWTVNQGRIEVHEQVENKLSWVHRDRGGGLQVRRWLTASSNPIFEVENIGKRRAEITVSSSSVANTSKAKQFSSITAVPRLASPYLPLHQVSVFHLDPDQVRSFAIAHNGDQPLGFQVDISSFLSSPSLALIPHEDLLAITTPWPPTGAAGVLSVDAITATVTAPGDKLGTPGLKIASSESAPRRVVITPIAAKPTTCIADRYDQLGKTPTSSVTLLATTKGLATVVGNLSACPGTSDRFEIEVEQDDLLELAMLSDGDHAALRLTAPGGQICLSTVQPDAPITGLRPSQLAPVRRHLACWIEKSGVAKVVVEPKASHRYDLATRVR